MNQILYVTLKRAVVILSAFCLLCRAGISQQVVISGDNPNHYLQVDEVLTNGVRVTQTITGELDHFMPGDKIMVIQMTGVINDTSDIQYKTNPSQFIVTIEYTNTGRFEILQLDEVNTNVGGDTVIYFTDNLSNNYDVGEKIQVVKLVEAETVTLNGTVRPRAWDGKVGGILGIIATDSVKLSTNSVLDASSRGFRGGAVPDEIYASENSCRYGLSSSVADTMYFTPVQLSRSGNKGEGIISASWPFTKGTAFNVNGGGAGNGRFSGGGGGSNYSVGGKGGDQSAYCTLNYSASGGLGGYGCNTIYNASEYPDIYEPRVIMGGGGGSGTRMESAEPSRGGDGGGIIVIITGTLHSEAGAVIRSNGGDANPLTTAGSGAGGGAAGSVLIDAEQLTGTYFSVELKGGSGASTTTPEPHVNGTGGGGSGGVFWHAGTSFPSVSVNRANGSPGTQPGGVTYIYQNGSPGNVGITLNNLIVPLNGFLFNSVRGVDTLCSGQVPGLLTASQPKGGSGSYTYVWQDSTATGSWQNVTGGAENTLRTYQPGELLQTTWFRRVVTSDTITDISRPLEVFVYPAIANNALQGADTICYNADAGLLSGISTPLSGGNNSYTFTWQDSTGVTGWNNIGTNAGFDPGRLITSTYYRRIVKSTAYCADISDTVFIRVLPSITDNSFAHPADTAICFNTGPGRLAALMPANGDGSFTYQWQLKAPAGEWIAIENTTDSVHYTVNVLTETTAFRRIVFSGPDNACIDTSDDRTVNIMPPIANNRIMGSTIQYTCYNSPASLTGASPQDGFGTYGYAWEQSSDNASWESIPGNERDLVSAPLTTPMFFRRIVHSTPAYHECSDVSDAVEVRINPLPTGNVVNTFDTLCAGETLEVHFNVSGNGPFNVTLRDGNGQELSKNMVTGPLDSIAFVPSATTSFIMASVVDDSACVANTADFIAIEPARVYVVPVANAGTDSEICGITYTMQAVKSVDGSVGSWTSSEVVFGNDSIPNTLVTANRYGPVVFTWTETNWHCTDNDEVEIIFHEMPAEPYAGEDQVLDFNYTTRLEATPASVGSGKWSVSSGTAAFTDDSQPDAVVSELAESTVLKWTVINGNCPALSDSMQIAVKPLEVIKGFTPDGVKNYFDFNAPNAEQITVKIYNSAGMLV
ncbi:MAG: hypothetical protein JXQ80_03420, partial [Bacteroidales bacterium]|nr:hypothetical protein [Bacteroidales bacterium]